MTTARVRVLAYEPDREKGARVRLVTRGAWSRRRVVAFGLVAVLLGACLAGAVGAGWAGQVVDAYLWAVWSAFVGSALGLLGLEAVGGRRAALDARWLTVGLGRTPTHEIVQIRAEARGAGGFDVLAVRARGEPVRLAVGLPEPDARRVEELARTVLGR